MGRLEIGTARDGGFYLLFLAVFAQREKSLGKVIGCPGKGRWRRSVCPVALSKALLVQERLRFFRFFRYRGCGEEPGQYGEWSEMLRIGVCDDEDGARAYLAALVRGQCGNWEVTEYTSAEEYLSSGREHDLLFLDIELGAGTGVGSLYNAGEYRGQDWEEMTSTCATGTESQEERWNCATGAGSQEERWNCAAEAGSQEKRWNCAAGTGSQEGKPLCTAGPEHRMDGMALARRIREGEGKQPLIIFVTGYEEYVYDAFDVGAFHYLLKPIEERRFLEIFHRALQVVEGDYRSEKERKNCPEQNLEKAQGNTLMVHWGGVSRAVPIQSIRYLESRGHKVILHLEDREVEYYARIRDLEEALGEAFFRIHKGYLAGLSHVESYSRTEVVLTSGVRLPVSKYKYGDFVKVYLRFLQQGGTGK